MQPTKGDRRATPALARCPPDCRVSRRCAAADMLFMQCAEREQLERAHHDAFQETLQAKLALDALADNGNADARQQAEERLAAADRNRQDAWKKLAAHKRRHACWQLP